MTISKTVHLGYRNLLLTPIKAIVIATLSFAIIACQTGSPQMALAAKPAGSASAYLYTEGITAQQLSRECTSRLTAARAHLLKLEQLKAPYTVESVLVPVDQLLTEINNATGLTFLLNNVHPQEDIQSAADDCVQAFTGLLTDIGLSQKIYQHISDVDSATADEQTRRFQHRMLRDFRRAGVDRSEQDRKKLRALNDKITDLGQQFSKNIRNDVRTLKLSDASALQGLPQDYINSHAADSDGTISITTDYPDLLPFLRYSRDDAARKQLYQQYLSRAYPVNQQILQDILEARYQQAILLGYKDYASYTTEIMMVEDPLTVAHFIERINLLAIPRAQRDYAQLLTALQAEQPELTQVGSWQKSYAEELVRIKQYDVDTKQLRQYFQYGRVKDGIFKLVEDLFGIEIKPWQTATWHPSVESYAIWENGEMIGRFYLDMHPRPGKYKHAAEYDVAAGIKGQQLPVAALVCNFPGEDDPSELMEHEQVETFLHEFGHLLHHIFSGQQTWGLFSGVATEQDFVEAPSQMLEEWTWDYPTLSQFAVNKAGEPIPLELVNKLRKARDFGRGVQIRNQLFYAALSLNYYQIPPDELDLKQTMIEQQNRYSPFPYLEGTHFYASFGHLFGYSAAYYTYMWSEVIAADILEQFKVNGMHNKAVARKYRQTILAPGGSKDASDLIVDFLGRPFSFDAFVNDLNKE